MFVIITCNNWDWILWGKKTTCSLWLLGCFLYFVFFALFIFFFFYLFCSLTDLTSCFLYNIHWIYSNCDVLVSIPKPKAVALVQYSICVCPLCLMLLCSQSAKSFQAYQTTIYAGLICSTYTTTMHAIALHTTWQLLCVLQIIQHVSCHHRSLHSPPHPVWKPRAGALPDRAASVSGTTDFWGRNLRAQLTSHCQISGIIWFPLSKTSTCMRWVSLLLTPVR